MKQNPKEINYDLSKSTAVKCATCSNETFMEVTFIRKISKILIGQAQDGILPIPAMKCTNCGDILQELLPKELRTTTPEVSKPNIPGIKFKP